MKTLFVKIPVIIAAMILTFKANAQTDYVITVKGDSIPCSISTSLAGKEKYKVGAMSDSKRIKPGAIREYYMARKNILERSVYTDRKASPVFMIVIEKGPISLYKTVPFNRASTTKWYVGKGSDNVSDLKTGSLFLSDSRQRRKDVFGEMLKDNKQVYDKYVAEDKFGFKQIRTLVHLYDTGQLLKD
jgi:hypothetical protein